MAREKRKNVTPRYSAEVRASRFWSKVRKAGEDDCWIWQGRVADNGYGTAYWSADLNCTGAHRIAYCLHTKTPIESLGLFVLHKCDTPLCCNPKHLFIGTQQDNVDDMVAKKRSKLYGHGKSGVGNSSDIAKLDEAAARDILTGYRPGIRGELTRFAKKHRVTISCVWRVVNRQTWKHVKV